MMIMNIIDDLVRPTVVQSHSTKNALGKFGTQRLLTPINIIFYTNFCLMFLVNNPL